MGVLSRSVHTLAQETRNTRSLSKHTYYTCGIGGRGGGTKKLWMSLSDWGVYLSGGLASVEIGSPNFARLQSGILGLCLNFTFDCCIMERGQQEKSHLYYHQLCFQIPDLSLRLCLKPRGQCAYKKESFLFGRWKLEVAEREESKGGGGEGSWHSSHAW